MNSCPNLYILMAMPVTVAAGERRFSKLKLIKAYLTDQRRAKNI